MKININLALKHLPLSLSPDLWYLNLPKLVWMIPFYGFYIHGDMSIQMDPNDEC